MKLLLLLSCVLISCCSTPVLGPEKSKTPAGFSQELILVPDQSVVLSPISPDSRPALTVHIVQLDDSRCLPTVTCIWAGAAKVTLSLNIPGPAPQEATLCLGDCRGIPGRKDGFRETDTTEVRVGQHTYTLRLKAASPSASAQNSPLILIVTQKLN